MHHAGAHQLESPLACRNADGAPVDWFVVLKLPDGDHYAYIDSTFSPPDPSATGPAGGYKWAVAAGLAAQGEGPLAKTLLPLYASKVRICQSKTVTSLKCAWMTELTQVPSSHSKNSAIVPWKE